MNYRYTAENLAFELIITGIQFKIPLEENRTDIESETISYLRRCNICNIVYNAVYSRSSLIIHFWATIPSPQSPQCYHCPTFNLHSTDSLPVLGGRFYCLEQFYH